MTSLDRAKRFLGQKASRLALSVVPLAALAVSAVPAKAGIIFDPQTCFTSPSSSGSCSVTQQGANGGNSIANWLTMSANGVSSGAGSFSFSVGSGSASGDILGGTIIPVSWDFNLLPEFGGNPIVNYAINIDIEVLTGGGSIFPNFSFSGSGAVGTSVHGTDAITVPISGGGTVQAYDINLTFNASDSFGVSIPGGTSVDLNPDSTPEPATLLLLPMGGAFLFLRRKRLA